MFNPLAVLLAAFSEPLAVARRVLFFTRPVDLDTLRTRWTTTPRPHRTWPGCQSRAQRRARRVA